MIKEVALVRFQILADCDGCRCFLEDDGVDKCVREVFQDSRRTPILTVEGSTGPLHRGEGKIRQWSRWPLESSKTNCHRIDCHAPPWDDPRSTRIFQVDRPLYAK